MGGGEERFAWRGETIHIFSVASGHLYERFLKIMMLSVRRNTRNPLKFWFIKNWLSPQFKDFLPHIAEEYGFEYELVTYKWPTWLNKQTEKQRIIWAYKLLFLDVLFPLTLNKVIFVDADQVVRADMAELWHMDLKGAPYAYTPFCDNNKEMEGYRFWKQGFWKNHLAGRPYHISALYVVDLDRFRRTAATIDCASSTNSCRRTRGRWRTSIRTCPTTRNTRFQSSASRSRGCGASRGAGTRPRRRRRPSTCATTP